MRRSLLSPSIIVALTFAFMSDRADASLFYDFEEDGTGTVLATLELASLPATHTEVLGLTFTLAGQAVFGYGPTYVGVFDTSIFAFVDDGSGGLESSYSPSIRASLLDQNPPFSPIAAGGNAFELIAGRAVVEPLDEMLMGGFVYGDVPDAYGDWVVVPEPSCLVLAVSAVLVGVGVGRRRKCAA
jgi:hypothetical protein